MIYREILRTFAELYKTTGLVSLSLGDVGLLFVGLLFIYLGVRKKLEPLLLIPIGFGILLANFPGTGLMENDGLLRFFYRGIAFQILPPLIFLGVGALTDFTPLLSSPRTMLLGVAAQFGIFGTLIGALVMQFDLSRAAAIGIIGGADGPTAIFVSADLAPELVGPIAVAAYSYMALVPIIQPPVIKALTSPEERAIPVEKQREVNRIVVVLFPIVAMTIAILLVPASAPLIGMLMLGNFLRECGVVDRLSNSAQEEIVNVVTLFLGLAVGASLSAEVFWNVKTIGILVLGVVAFMLATASGVLMGKAMSRFSSDPFNPIIGAAGVSAVPMAARVVQKVGHEANRDNYLLMLAMGANVSGVIGSALVAGILLSLVG